ncbi:MarR family winged helix-turn-helix transcriptional regulator [Arthrobacter sp.]|uniref:MarR family winged helix-turn-helix transcriptional regulator n=1 Tax=Arthrobacter sp. TaxID=1667 RepID=UPI0026DFCC97|nr:MarR family winged helix-turn-helix transcriptional regulator [Arthrobacter sp.]MDO5754280.1 MarR family winged helix-turn-helix transcriptional regulator [Arthrobacter sp.]
METRLDVRGEPDAAIAAVRSLVRVSRLLERSLDELSLPHYRVLAAISAGEERASRVAARLELGRPAVSAAVASLAERGLLVRTDVAGDQRAAGLRLTEAGAQTLARADAAMSAALRILAAKTNDPEGMLETLGRLNEAVSETYAQRMAGLTGVEPGTVQEASPSNVSASVHANGPAVR